MSVSEFQQALHKFRTTLKMCSHKSDYVVLYNYMDMEHLLCHFCWNEEKPIRIDEDLVKIYRPNQLRAVRVQCLNCDTLVTEQKNCTRCFPEQ